jgi:hypothetical protein
MQSTRYSCPILMKLGVYQPIFENYCNMKCDENPFGGNRIVPCRRKNRHDEANSCFSAILRTRLRTFIGFVQCTYLNLSAEKTMGSSTLAESTVILQLQ